MNAEEQKKQELAFQRAKRTNEAFLPKNIENMDEILHGINKLEWIPLGMTFSEWYKKKAGYKK